MTEKRKQELRQLLNQAIESLEIRRSKAGVLLPSIDVRKYKELLLHRWSSHSEDSPLVWANFDPIIKDENTKSKLLDFIREEFAQFIHEDRIKSACSLISVSRTGGYPLRDLLVQLLKIAIGQGIERAISNFDRYTKETHASVRYMALLEGIKLETKTQVFDGIQLIPLPESPTDLPSYLPSSIISIFSRSANFFCAKTLLIIDCFISPVFYSPLQEKTIPEHFKQKNRAYQVNVDGVFENFCQALSLACNSAVQISLEWPFWPEDELFYLGSPTPGPPRINVPAGLFGAAANAAEAHIEKAKRLYEKLGGLNSNDRERLQIAIERWIMSKTERNRTDKIIDLGIAFETLFLSDVNEELTFRLGVRAAWYLGKDKQHRKELLKKFGDIYRCRSNAVHSGRLDEPVRFGDERIPINEFIERVQDLCRDSIMKVLNTEQFPDRNYWDGLIVSGEDQQASSA